MQARRAAKPGNGAAREDDERGSGPKGPEPRRFTRGPRLEPAAASTQPNHSRDV
jgi:hypothetical protein